MENKEPQNMTKFKLQEFITDGKERRATSITKLGYIKTMLYKLGILK